MAQHLEPTPENMIAQPLVTADFLMEETSPEVATPMDPSRDALEARIDVVERAAQDLGAFATTAHAILTLVRP